MESPEENCAALVKNVLIQQLHLQAEIVHSMKFCGDHRLGKQNASKTRPLTVRFTCRFDRELVWKNRFHLKDSPIADGEEFPKQIQDSRKKVLVPAMLKIKKKTLALKPSSLETDSFSTAKGIFTTTFQKNGCQL